MFWEFFKFKAKEENPSFDSAQDRSNARISIGKSGEDEAARLLEKKGYKILERNYRTRCFEVDIIAKDGKTVVFVEVKKRQSARYGSAKEAIGRRKMKRLVMAAKDYMSKRRQGLEREFNVRFD